MPLELNSDNQNLRKRVTIKDIALAAKVTPATVSSILNDKKLAFKGETVQRVKQLAQELGYVTNTLARGLVQGKSNTIGIVFIGNTDEPFASPLLLQLISGICGIVNQAQYSIFLAPPPHIMSNDDMVSFLDSIFLSRRVDACIMIGPPPLEFHVHLAALRYDIPFALVGRIPGTTRLNMVDVNNESVGYLAIQHLRSRGAASVVCFSHDMIFQFSRDRAEGVKAALREWDVGQPDENIHITGNLATKEIKQLLLQLKNSKGGLDGLYAMNHTYPQLVNLINAIEELGWKIPDDLRLVSDDDGSANVFAIPLTTIRLDSKRIGEEAARLILDRLKNCSPGFMQVFIEPELIQRSST